ncbi:MAG TPA: adenosylmethionine decarboxylase [Pirellulales bacterium]|nr:adenosylmethionine decarboxylase [Pirellulales bacterium]
MPASNLTQSSPKTSWFGRWLAAWRRRSGGESERQRPALPPNASPERYEFFGRHLLASYVDCDPAALADHAGLKAAMSAAVAAAGATLLDSAHYSFTPSGMTAVMLLAESHASIHTYPEHQACFVDLFTCGRACSAEKFDATLREYLRPGSVQRRTVLRHADGIEMSPAGAEDWLAEWAA